MRKKVTYSPAIKGRRKAARLYPKSMLGVCAECEVAPATDRHHWDRDTLNNAPTNVVFLCHRCHQRLHWKTHCIHGHPMSGHNLIVAQGRRYCRACNQERARQTYARHQRIL